MTPEEAEQRVIRWAITRAAERLAASQRELDADTPYLAIDHAYYACFHVVSAVLLQDGHAFKRHSGLRAALHQRLVATGRLPQDLGRVFDDLAELRTKSVYAALFEVDAETASRLLAEARRLIEHLRPALP